jgi:rhamnogalacturonyl hydrolase YesR
MIATDKIDDWSWIDAIHMSMPVFARLGFVYNDMRYFDRAHEMYLYSKLRHGDNGLYSKEFISGGATRILIRLIRNPMERTVTGREQRWVVAALVRTLEFLLKRTLTGKSISLPSNRCSGLWEKCREMMATGT